MNLYAFPLTAQAFAPYGDVLDATGDFRLINDGMCHRHHDRARLDFGPAGRAGISIFNATPRALPYVFDLVERHPEGSQAFIPMTQNPFLVIVAPGEGGQPGAPLAFLTNGAQGINLHRGTWHGVLTPLATPHLAASRLAGPHLAGPGLFAAVDRIGTTANLEEFRYQQSWTVIGG